MFKKESTSWEPVKKWYQNTVGKEGHYYHQQLILPAMKKLLKFSQKSSLLDLCCGQGILARAIPDYVEYTGIDLAPSLIKEAKKMDGNPKHQYLVADASKTLSIPADTFTHATIILALQNVEFPEKVLMNAAQALVKEGKLLIVLNHPCFRIPRQSSWEVDQNKRLQYRRIDSYGSSMRIPIKAHPSKGEASPETFTFHHSLAQYSHWLKQAGFRIELLDEWYSDKVSEGGAAKMENRARNEFPLFLAIVAVKV